MIDGLTALMKDGDGLVLNADFDRAGLTVSGLATVKAGSPAAPGPGEGPHDLGRPDGASSPAT